MRWRLPAARSRSNPSAPWLALLLLATRSSEAAQMQVGSTDGSYVKEVEVNATNKDSDGGASYVLGMRAHYLLGRGAFDSSDNWIDSSDPWKMKIGTAEESLLDAEGRWSDHPLRFDCRRAEEYRKNFTSGNSVHYFMDAIAVCEVSPAEEMIISFGDRLVDCATCFVKSRLVPQSSDTSRAGRGALLPLNTRRHWGFTLAEALYSRPAHLKAKLIDDPYAWSKKKPVLFWRGSTTGEGLRRNYVDAAAGLVRNGTADIDIKFNGLVHGKCKPHCEDWLGGAHIRKENYDPQHFSRSEMLKYRYLFSMCALVAPHLVQACLAGC